MNLRKLFLMLRAYLAGAPLGDVVLLKLDALSSPKAEIVRQLEPFRDSSPAHDVALLRSLPAGSLGSAYASFLEANGIKPLVVSPKMREHFRERPYALRYTATHDLHHVLLGFDTGLAGEVGVLAFNVGQGSAPVGRFGLLVACVLYSLFAPFQAARIWHNKKVGLRLGKSADLVMAAPLESYFEEPLETVRARLKLPGPRESGVLSSSLFD